jgi:KDO2-lipid IV(A) lauroyltransferase
MVMANLGCRFFPRRIAYTVTNYLMIVFYFVYGESRRTMLANTEYILRFSGDNTEGPEFSKKVRRITKQVFINFGKQIYDMMLMTRYNRSALEEVFDFENVEKIGELLKRGKGVIGVTAHFSSWELCATMLAMQYGTINAVFMEHPNRGVNNFYFRQRAARNVNAIMPGKNSFKGCLDALRRGELLAIVGDIDFTNSGMEVTFLGKRFKVPKGPPILALRSGSPIFCAAFLRTGQSRIKLEFGKVIEPPGGTNMDEKITFITNEYLRYFEKIILRDPSQWIMFYELAKLPPAGPQLHNEAETVR